MSIEKSEKSNFLKLHFKTHRRVFEMLREMENFLSSI